MKSLHISNDLSLPQDAVTEALAWIGARRSGKTHGAGKLAEEFAAAGIPFVWLDPVGVAYGLRLAKDGKGHGLSIPVFGGLHGDVPLEPTAGALIADLVADKNLSAILDVSQFDTDAQKARFTADFAERLFQRKKNEPSVLHWIVDEAQEFVPQNPQPGEQMMLHRMQRVLKLGRNFGIGVSLLTQRPQETSKKALNQCQTVFAFRVTGPQERKAMKEWIAAHDLDQTLVEKLPSLETGTCHVWSPAFLKVSKEINIAPKTTFDASATPKFGERRAAHALAPIDLEKIKAEMAATIEKAKAEDPKELRRQIAELKAMVGKQPAIAFKDKVVEKRVEVPVLKDGQIKRLEATVCGCCVRFQCQRPGCPKTPWRPKKELEGRGKMENHYCSKSCSAMVKAAALKAQRLSQSCDCGCGRLVVRPASNVRTERVYFSPKCHYAHRVMMKMEARRSVENCDVQALACYSDRCRGEVRDHVRVESGAMSCTYCNKRRPDDVQRIGGVPRRDVAETKS